MTNVLAMLFGDGVLEGAMKGAVLGAIIGGVVELLVWAVMKISKASKKPHDSDEAPPRSR